MPAVAAAVPTIKDHRVEDTPTARVAAESTPSPKLPTQTLARPPGQMPQRPIVSQHEAWYAAALSLEAQATTDAELERAFDLYCKAGRDGHAGSLVRLGWMYADGRGVARNTSAAATLFDRAARFGDAGGLDLSRGRFKIQREVLPTCLKNSAAAFGVPSRAPSVADVNALTTESIRLIPMRAQETASQRRSIIRLIATESHRMRIDPRLVLAIAATESGFNPEARSARDARGIMQLILDTANRFVVQQIDDPKENIRGGIAYLRWLLSYFRGNVALTAAAYNAGEGNVDKFRGVPPFAETRAYVGKIKAAYPFPTHPYDPQVSRTTSVAVSVPPAGDILAEGSDNER